MGGALPPRRDVNEQTPSTAWACPFTAILGQLILSSKLIKTVATRFQKMRKIRFSSGPTHAKLTALTQS